MILDVDNIYRLLTKNQHDHIHGESRKPNHFCITSFYNLKKEVIAGGEKIFNTYCAADWVKKRLIGILLNGLEGTIVVNGETFINAMPQRSFLKDVEVANVLTYIRSSFGNKSSEVTEAEVKDLSTVIANK